MVVVPYIFIPKKIMKKYAKTGIVIISSTLIFLIYYKQETTLNNNVCNSHSVIPNTSDPQDFIINGKGCVIPNYIRNWTYSTAKTKNKPCERRAIFITSVGNDRIKFKIDNVKMKHYLKRNVKLKCCYRFGLHQSVLGRKQVYTDCIPFVSGTVVTPRTEVIRVSCEMNNKKRKPEYIYDDVFIRMKPIKLKQTKKSTGKSWNVLLLGIGTMSRARFYKSLPQTVKYLRSTRWVDYKGYHTVGHNTLPNLVSLLTGRNISSFNKECTHDLKNCNNVSIWQQFKNAGYITAFGDDHFQLSNVFSKHKLHSLPSHHYLQSFISNEGIISKKYSCIKTFSTQLLDYAKQFVNHYKSQNFFGMFWISSYDNGVETNPSIIDKDLIEFLKHAKSIGILRNTFIILLSDHGITEGKLRIPVESYYEERLPMLFIRVPEDFMKLFRYEASNVRLNQDSILSPYDLYVTLTSILSISSYYTEATNADSCHRCTSLFTKYSKYRTCDDIGINEQWCTCHNMISTNDEEKSVLSLNLAVTYIQMKSISIKTIPCSKCQKLELKSVLRKHFYWYANKLYYVIAFKMFPGDLIYEVTILENNNKLSIIPPVLNLSLHGKGNCVVNNADEMYCICNLTTCNKEIIP